VSPNENIFSKFVLCDFAQHTGSDVHSLLREQSRYKFISYSQVIFLPLL